MSKKKAELGLYLNPNFVFSYSEKNITEYIITATRGVGKTVIALETAIILKNKYGWDNVKIYWFRLTDLSVKAMLADDADKAVDQYLVKKYGLKISCKNNTVYNKNKPFIEFYPLVSAMSKGKGVNLYDCTWFADPTKKRFVVTVWDEFMQDEGVSKKSIGDPVKQYNIYREAIYRDAENAKNYNCAYNFLLANNVGEAAAVTGAMYNYIPKSDCFRRVKLTRRHAIYWNVPITEAYREKRAKSINAAIIDYNNDANYTNIIKDLSMIKAKKTRINKVTRLYKFTDFKTDWFCLYDDMYIRRYRNESVNKDLVVPMRRYIENAVYNDDVVKSTFDRFDALAFKYTDIMSMELFKAQLRLLKE